VQVNETAYGTYCISF